MGTVTYWTKRGGFIYKYFYLPKSYNPDMGHKTIDDLNHLLNDIGVSFNVSKNNNGHTLHITVDEENLKKAACRPKTGRPVEYDFDLQKIQKMKDEGKTNKQIYTELGMSKSLFYQRLKECKNNIGQ